MTKKRKAQLCDEILSRFDGDKTIFWRDLHGPKKIFNDIVKDNDSSDGNSPDDKYYVIESHINFLVAEGMLRRKDQEKAGNESLCLTDKGYSTMRDLKNLGYKSKYFESNKNNIWKKILQWISIVTLILVSIRFINDFFLHPNQRSSDKPKERDTIVLKSFIPLDSNNKVNQKPSIDTTRKQIKKFKRKP